MFLFPEPLKHLIILFLPIFHLHIRMKVARRGRRPLNSVPEWLIEEHNLLKMLPEYHSHGDVTPTVLKIFINPAGRKKRCTTHNTGVIGSLLVFSRWCAVITNSIKTLSFNKSLAPAVCKTKQDKNTTYWALSMTQSLFFFSFLMLLYGISLGNQYFVNV